MLGCVFLKGGYRLGLELNGEVMAGRVALAAFLEGHILLVQLLACLRA